MKKNRLSLPLLAAVLFFTCSEAPASPLINGINWGFESGTYQLSESGAVNILRTDPEYTRISVDEWPENAEVEEKYIIRFGGGDLTVHLAVPDDPDLFEIATLSSLDPFPATKSPDREKYTYDDGNGEGYTVELFRSSTLSAVTTYILRIDVNLPTRGEVYDIAFKGAGGGSGWGDVPPRDVHWNVCNAGFGALALALMLPVIKITRRKK